MRYLFTILLSFITLSAFATEPTRQSYIINDGWQFFYGDAHDSDTAEHICLPHTWNTHNEYDYKRTTANYTRRVWIPAEWQGKRLFLRADALLHLSDRMAAMGTYSACPSLHFHACGGSDRRMRRR
jgi:beta-galactosidase